MQLNPCYSFCTGGIFMDILQLINRHNTIYICRPLAHILGINAAIVYSALISKQVFYRQNLMLDKDGFFYSTADDLEESTTLSARCQSAAIKKLIEAGLIEYKRKGIPAKRYFRVRDDMELVKSLLGSDEVDVS